MQARYAFQLTAGPVPDAQTRYPGIAFVGGQSRQVAKMSQALRQAWWAPIAVLLVAGQLLVAVTEGSFGYESGVAIIVIALVGALVLAVGIWRRPNARLLGNALIVIGSLFGAFWFWTLYGPVLAVIVIVGVVSTEVRSPARAATP
jgi:hypothetical protein